MQKLEILIEEKAFGSVRPVEVVANAPLSALVPALVEELNLPQTDRSGRKRVYMLRYTPGGRILPASANLIELGVQPGTRLALDSFVMEGRSRASLKKAQPDADPTFFSSATLADQDGIPALKGKATLPGNKKKGRWTRRAFLMLGGAILGAGGAGLGYAAHQALMNGTIPAPLSLMNRMATHPTATHVPAKRPFPTMAKAVFSFTQHQQRVRTVTWSPDGTMLASGADDAQLLVWSVNGTVLQSVQHPGSVRALSWSPDGQQLVTGAANQVTFLHPLTGTILARSTHRHSAAVTSLAWSLRTPLRVVSGALDKRAIVWNTTTYHPETAFTLHTTPIESASWAADGQTVGTSSLGGVVRVWNADTDQEIHGFFSDAQVPLRASAFAPSGMQLAAGGDDGVVRLWNGLICQQQGNSNFGLHCLDNPHRLRAHTKAVEALAWSSDAQFLATGGNDQVVAIWYPIQTSAPVLTLQLDAPVHAIAWSPNGRQLATAAGNMVTIWELT